MSNIKIIITKGPSFTQGPEAVELEVSRNLHFDAFRDKIKKLLRAENVSATKGLERSHISVRNLSNNPVTNKQSFESLLANNPDTITVEILDFLVQGKKSIINFHSSFSPQLLSFPVDYMLLNLCLFLLLISYSGEREEIPTPPPHERSETYGELFFHSFIYNR